MAVSRRVFFKVGQGFLLGLGVAALSPLRSLAANREAPVSGIDVSNYASFKPFLNRSFAVESAQSEGDRQNCQLKLVAMSDRIPHVQKNSHQLNQFSLTFKGDKGQLLAQNTYRFKHPIAGNFDLFIVPLGDRPDAAYYQASFSHITS